MRTTKKSTQKTPGVLTGFIALSLLAHGLFFLLQTTPQNRLVQAPLGTHKLSVSLTSSNISASTDADAKKPLRKTPQKTVKQIAITEISNQPATLNHDFAAAATKHSNQQAALKITQRNFLLGKIQHRLSRYLTYPTRARRRGWQGDVMIGFHVDKQGFLHNVHLRQTSGYSLLDNAALSAIGKIKNISLTTWSDFSRDNIFQPTSLQFPVTYRLTDS